MPTGCAHTCYAVPTVATPVYRIRVDPQIRSRWQAAASERGLTLPAAIHEAMEEWMGGQVKAAGASGSAVAVFVPKPLPAVRPEDPKLPPAPELGRALKPRVDVSGMVQRLRDQPR